MLIDFRIIFYFSEKKLILDFGYCMVPKSELSTGKVDVNAPAADVTRNVNRGKLVLTPPPAVDVNRKLTFDVNCRPGAPARCTSAQKVKRQRPAVECQPPRRSKPLLTSGIPSHTVGRGDAATLL